MRKKYIPLDREVLFPLSISGCVTCVNVLVPALTDSCHVMMSSFIYPFRCVTAQRPSERAGRYVVCNNR